MPTPPQRKALKNYADAIALWNARYDTAEIAQRLGLAEHVVARWVANFRDVVRGVDIPAGCHDLAAA